MGIIVFILLLGFVVLIALPIVAMVMTRSTERELREELSDLKGKFLDLETLVLRMVQERKREAEQAAAAHAVAPQGAAVTRAAEPVAAITPFPEPLAVKTLTTGPVTAAPLIAPPVPGRTDPAFVAPAPVPIPTPFPAPAHVAVPISASALPAARPVRIEIPPEPVLQRAAADAADKEESRAERAFSLEERLGKNWLNKLGVAILVIGLAFFLAYKLQTWGPAGKVLCGFAVSAALLGGGVWLERKETYRILARAGIGGGWALAFFTVFAMHHIPAARVLDSLIADLVLMLLAAAGMVGHSLRYRSQTVTGLAFLLGFATLLTSHLEASNGTVVFSLTASAVLALGLVVVTTMRHWARLEVAGLAAVYTSHFVWLTLVLPEDHRQFPEFWVSAGLIVFYWLIFRLAYVFRTPLDKGEENTSSLAAVLNSGGVLGLLKYQAIDPEFAFWALAAMGAVEMALAFKVRRQRRQAFVVLSTISTVLLVSAVPFHFHGVSWPVLWLVEAQVLAVCGLRMGEPVFRRLGLLTGVVTGGVLAFHDVLPLGLLRLDYPDPGGHMWLAVALGLAAILYWVHAEIYPRRWPQIAGHDAERFALRVTSWLGIGAAAAALWVAVPDLWLPVAWLGLALVVGFAGQRFGAIALVHEGDVLALGTALVLAFDHVLPLMWARLSAPDASHHPAETTVLALGAVAYWIRGEIFTRVFERGDGKKGARPEPTEWQRVMPVVASCLGTAVAAAALWVVLPAPWIVVGWLVLAVVTGLAADWVKSVSLAMQTDTLTIAAVLGLLPWDAWTAGWWEHEAPLTAAIALLYVCMRRRTVQAGSPRYVAGLYSWIASVLMAVTAWDMAADIWLAVVWVGLGVALFEIGRGARKGFLRWQGFLLVGLAFAKCIVYDIAFGAPAPPKIYPIPFSIVNSALLEVLLLAAAGYWVLERSSNGDRCKVPEQVGGVVADGLGTLSIALWFGFRFPSEWVPVPDGAAWVTGIWAAMAALLMGMAWLMRRRAFVVWAVALAIAVVVRGLLVDLMSDGAAGFWNGPLVHVEIAALVLLCALPLAFRLRGAEFWKNTRWRLPMSGTEVLSRPEQWFFFLPLGMTIIALAVKLSSGHITIAWSLVGLAVFLFALVVGERTYRLAGLALLMVSVVKILLMDVWKLEPSDRYTTLIVLGLALLAVSFLYTRFSTVIRRYL
jgi:uncharacterized membrane protein